MSRLVVRDGADFEHAVRILKGPLAKTIREVRCEGWPRLVLEAEDRLGVRCSQRISDMQESVARIVCAMKYGTDDLRHLKAVDKRAIELGITYAPDQRGLAVDFSGAANVALQAANDAGEKSKWRIAGLFEWLKGESKGGTETGLGAALKLGLAVVDKCPSWQITAALMLTVLVGFNNVADVYKQKNTLEHAFKMHVEDNQQALRLAELNRSVIVGRAGRVAAVDTKVRQALDKADKAAAERMIVLARMELEHPLVRFVSAEAENIFAAALDMAPENGTTTINGLKLPAKTAWSGAKAVRQASKAKQLANDGWTAVVQRANDV